MSGVVWMQTPDRTTWRAVRGPLLLTVSKASSGTFTAVVECPGVADRAPGFRTRVLAQRWAEQQEQAGGAA